MTEVNKKFLYVVFLPQEWEIYHRRPYWEAMAEHAEVLLIEPPVGILIDWLRPRRIKNMFGGLKKIEGFKYKIYLYRPYQLLSPGFSFVFSLFNAIDKFLLRRQLKNVLKKTESKYDHVISFIVHVHQQHFSKVLSYAIQCYEITDLYLIPYGHHELDMNHWYTKKAMQCEQKLLDNSDIVITSSSLVYDKYKDTHEHIHFMTNAADYNHFANSTDENLTIPSEIANVPKPVIGFVGYINHLIDFELITKLATTFADASIVLIGGVQKISKVTDDAHYQKTLQLPNVHYLGFKKYDALPSYMKSFDVSLMPFRLNDWMKYSAPNKTYQYLATGKPIVSTNFTEVRQYSDIICVAKDPDEFIAMVKNALNEGDESQKQKRQQIAFDNSTEKRAIKLTELVAKTVG